MWIIDRTQPLRAYGEAYLKSTTPCFSTGKARVPFLSTTSSRNVPWLPPSHISHSLASTTNLQALHGNPRDFIALQSLQVICSEPASHYFSYYCSRCSALNLTTPTRTMDAIHSGMSGLRKHIVQIYGAMLMVSSAGNNTYATRDGAF